MAGKPELSVSPQQQPPGVQNVVVYVSNDNFAQAYAVGQQNVAAFPSQPAAAPQQNGGGAPVQYAGGAHTLAPVVASTKTKPALKPAEFQSNGAAVLENGGTVAPPATGGFYACNTSPVLAANGFPQPCSTNTSIVNNLAAYHGGLNSIPVLNANTFDATVKNVIGINASVSPSAPAGELYSLTGSQPDKAAAPRLDPAKVPNESETYIATESGYVAVMGTEVTGPSAVTFPRCDSVRSETAESSCSSLSSGDSQGEASIVLMPASQAPASAAAADLVMYDSNNSVSVSMRPAQSLGNLVLTMVPPSAPAATQVTGLAASSAHSPTTLTVPLGWKRIVTNGIVIYISPSSTALSSLDQVKEYLMTQGTCKCGLECPLKYDAVFNFDPKMSAKPYTLSPETSTGDLTKLCNHKRKLLAMASLTTQPSAHKPGPAPAAIPLDPTKLRKDGGLKRKKRKLGPYSGISVSQLLAQREKLASTQQVYAKDPLSNMQFTQQQQQQSQQQQQAWAGPMIPGVQNINRQTFVDGNMNANAGLPQQFIRYPNQAAAPVNRVVSASSMMVGGSMMIPQQPTTLTNLTQQQQQIQQQLQNQQMIYHQIQNANQQPAAVNQTQQHHIIGPNGQVISIQQPQGHLGQLATTNGQVINGSVNHVLSNGAVLTNNSPNNGIVIHGQNMNITSHHQQQQQQQQQQRMIASQVTGDVRNIGRAVQNNTNIIPNVSNGTTLQQHSQQEFNQRIQQQQFFGPNIQYQNLPDQNKMLQQQQQFDNSKNIRPNFVTNNNNMVFAGYRTDGTSQNTVMVPQSHQMVMMGQAPQKPSNWQQNKSASPANNTPQQNIINSVSQQTSTQLQQNQINIQVNQNSNVYERVPPLHHHTPPPPIWNDELNRKKIKMSKLNKKQRLYSLDQQRLPTAEQSPQCPNIDVRQIPVENNKSMLMNNQYSQNSSGPSFMEDPSGYLAQQTALLNSTISRQTGASNCTNYMCHSPSTSPQTSHPQTVNNVSNSQHGIPLPSNMMANQMKPTQIFNNRTSIPNANMVKTLHNPQQSTPALAHIQQYHPNNNVPDSSAIGDNNASVQCQSCIGTSDQYQNNHEHSDGRLSQYSSKQQIRIYQQSQSRPSSQPSTPNPSLLHEDNPVTSSTYVERHGSQSGYVPSPDSRPIQGGTISTSNGSPVDGLNQPESSPTPSTPTPGQCNTDTPLINIPLNASSANFSLPNSSVVYSYSNQIANVTPVRDVCNSNVTVLSNIQVSQAVSSPAISTSTASGQSTSSVKLDGYCPHPHTTGSPVGIIPRIAGQTPFSVHSGMITTMASGRTVGHNTITSVLAGRASTATVSINSPATVPATSASTNPFTSQANALITAAAMPSQSIALNVSKSPLEMVQSVVSSIQIPHSQATVVNANMAQNQPIPSQHVIKQSATQALPPGHILVSSGGQLLMASTGNGNGQQGIMAPPPPKLVSNASPMPPLSASPMITNVTAAVTQMIPAVGVAQQVLGQQTVLVNALPAPFVIQPGVVTVDGMAVGQNMQIPHLVTGNVIQQPIHIDGNQEPSSRAQHHSPGILSRQPALLSPESNRKKGKKRKMSSQTVASMLHIASQQNSGMVMQQPQQGFSQPSFQMAHSPQGLTTGPMLQALTIVPGKAGVSPQIVMNGQPSAATSAFGTQQLITNSQPAPQINLLQPVNLLNGATGVVQNFPTIQQFIVPNLGGMVMAADGTATLVQDTSNLGMQLQLQNVNGQNVLTPVQGTGNMFNQGQSILAAGPAGMVIRTPGTTQNKIIQQQHSPGAQFLSPNGGQFLMNGAQFNSQLSPLIANVSPTQQVTFSTTPQPVRPNTSMQHAQQEFIQCGQMGQTLMVPCAPAPTITVTTASSQQNTTFVHQNTTIVQQQTTMVSNNQIQNFAANNQNNHPNTQNITESTTTVNVDQNFIINNNQSGDKPQGQVQSLLLQRQSPQNAAMLRHSVSTQTAVNQKQQASTVTTNTFCQTSMTASAGSPPDTTTHSPLAAGGQSPANADTTTHSLGTGSTDEGLSPSPSNSSMIGSCTDIIAIQARQAASMAMVHCISSSEPDSADLCSSGAQSDIDWSRNSSTNMGYKPEYDMSSGGHATHISRKQDTPTHMAYVESSTVVSGMHFVAESMKTQESVVSSRHYEKAALKRKHSDTLVVMETRHMHTSLQDDEEDGAGRSSQPFVVGELVWGPAHGCSAWPGKLIEISNKQEGRVMVRWFGGDKTPTEVRLAELQTLTEGLDAHHRARKKCRKSRKLNTHLENAIQEAMSELDRISEAQQQGKAQKQQTTRCELPEKETSASTLTAVATAPAPKGDIAGRLRSSQR